MFSNMKPAEKRLLDACQKGEVLNLGNERPTEKTVDNEIRGEFLRALILSNNQKIEESSKKYILKIDPKGIMFSGVFISGIFDFSFCSTNLPIFFENSIIENEINLMYSKIGLLYFLDSNLKAIKGYGLICVNDIIFNKLEVKGELNFGFSEIRNLIFIDGKISNQDGDALNCLSAIIKGNIQFSQNHIEGNLILSLAKIDNLLTLSNLKLIGSIEFESTKTNILNIEGSKFWEEDKLKEINFDGLEYNHLSGVNLDSKILINLLDKMPKEENFKPQPYKQLAKVLRNMGHHKEADDVMIEYNNKIFNKDYEEFKVEFKQAYNVALKEKWNFFKTLIKYIFENLGFLAGLIYGKTLGYGYKLTHVFITMFCVWFFCSLFYLNASKVAVFAPNNPLVFQKKDYYECHVEENGTSWSDVFNWEKYNSSNNWIDSKLEGEYTTFNPFWYSLDVILPIVDLQVEKDWAQYVPSNDWTLNDFTRWLMWFEILFGWIYSLILVAILSGLAKNEKD